MALKRKPKQMLLSNKKALGWIGVGATLILPYVLLRLTTNYFVAPSLPEPVQELHSWLVALLYWFLYAPATLALSLYIANLTGISD